METGRGEAANYPCPGRGVLLCQVPTLGSRERAAREEVCSLPEGSEVKVAQLCLTLCDPMEYTVHGILQARSLLQGIFPIQVSHIAGRFFTS